MRYGKCVRSNAILQYYVLQKDVYERHKTELLTDGAGAGGSSHSTPTSAATARKKAAKAASLVNHDTDSMYQFTSVLNNGPGGGRKQLRGTNTTRVLTDHWERTGRVVEKTPSKGGKSYVNDVLRCKHPGCRGQSASTLG
jgi:hypothetical protein